MANVEPDELESLKLAAQDILASAWKAIANRVDEGKLLEVDYGEEEN